MLIDPRRCARGERTSWSLAPQEAAKTTLVNAILDSLARLTPHDG